MAESKLNEMIQTSLEKIKELASTETVIGNPISVSGGITILPVSKISLGYATGGLDFPDKKANDGPTATKFGGAGGTGISVTPMAFLIVKEDGSTSLLPITNPTDADALDKITSLLDKSPDILARIKKVFTDKAKKEEPKEN